MDPYYQLPSDKAVKSMIHQAYNFSSELLQQSLKNTAISCSLTCDLWTARSHEAYLDVTCHWMDQDFKLNEVLLANIPCPYPHIGENIHDVLCEIMEK